jgi:hypothetical protein
MAWTTEGLAEQRQDFYADLTAVEIKNTEGTVLATVPKASFTNVSNGAAGPVTFTINLTGEDVGVGNTVSGYNFLKGTTQIGNGSFPVSNTAVTILDTFTLDFSVNNA